MGRRKNDNSPAASARQQVFDKALQIANRDKMMRPAEVANKELRSSLVRTRRALNELNEQIKDVLHKGIR